MVFQPLEEAGGYQGPPLLKFPYPDPLPGGEGMASRLSAVMGKGTLIKSITIDS